MVLKIQTQWLTLAFPALQRLRQCKVKANQNQSELKVNLATEKETFCLEKKERQKRKWSYRTTFNNLKSHR